MSQSPVRSLAAQSRRQLLLMAVAIFIGLLALVTVFSFYQISQAGKNYMRLDAIKLEQKLAADPNYPLPQSDTVSAYRDWQAIPESVRDLFSSEPIQPDDPIEIQRINDSGAREYGYLLYSDHHLSQGLYLVEFEAAEKIETLAAMIVERSLADASVLIAAFMLVLVTVIGLLFNNALKPLKELVAWSARVKTHPDKAIDVRFSVREVNQIADHLMASLQQVREHNQREQQFLKHASHELRTPLAIMQASLDTLSLRIGDKDASYPALQRASRANANMMALSESLLWLARQHPDKVRQSKVDLGSLCATLLDELAYIAAHKSVTVHIDDHSDPISIERELFRIASTNLIRNALTYSAPGAIEIKITNGQFSIANPIDSDVDENQLGFGLGLQLVERIAGQLNWHFEFHYDAQMARAVINWEAAHKMTEES
ncbi:sensor histidine kinase [Salinivibrio costicola]|uniref:histidine kinase n=1 Tax=Salinivibrio costicola TaxID=51367 RepID=A0ABX6K7Z3_SALCS|nr:HAMP domain-containing sensor histidine kinase [Salinivibrio costicola]QIR07642.1 HAMP domain-containing histidine kinase [Salinivibrio costicola]